MMKHARSFRVEAVVLSHLDWGEADRLLSLFTREYGKLRAVAKGARKVLSRKAGHLEPFTRVAVQLARGRELPIVQQVETLDAYLPIREDLVKLGYAAYALELMDRFTYDEEGYNPVIFRVLTDTLARIAAESDGWLAVRYYEMRLLDFLGFRPKLFECAQCGRPVEPLDQYFSPSAGGVICLRCGLGLPGLWSISVQTLKYLRHFQRSNYAEVLRARPSEESRKQVEAVMQGYFTYLLERELNTPGFLKQIKGQQAG